MGKVRELRGLGDVRTALGSRLHCKPAKGTAWRSPYLNLHLLDNEKERLEKELLRLERQQKRVREHLAEVLETIRALEKEAQEKSSREASTDVATEHRQPAPASQYSERRWKRMTLDY